MTDVEQQILTSPFVDIVRDHRFDENEFARLLTALDELAREWAAAETVNKSVAAELFVMLTIVRGAADRLSGSDLGNRMSSAAEELDTMAFRCLVPE